MKFYFLLFFLLTSFVIKADDYFVKSYVSNNFTTTDLEGKVTHYDKKTEMQVYVIDGQEHCKISLYQGEDLFEPKVLSITPLTTENEDEIMLLHNCVEQRENGEEIVSFLSFHYNLAKSRMVPSTVRFNPLFSGIYFEFLDIEENNRQIGEAEKVNGFVFLNKKNLKLPLKVIENPYNYSSKDKVNILRISLFEDETVVDFYCSNYRDDESIYEYCNINSKSHLQADGKKYELLKADNIAMAPSKTFFDTSKKIDQLNFTLHFQPVPLKTESIDFIEYKESEWNIYDIDLSNTFSCENEYRLRLKKEKIYFDSDFEEEIEDGVLKTCYNFKDIKGDMYRIFISQKGEGSAYIIKTNKKTKQLYKAYLGKKETELLKIARKEDIDNTLNGLINKARKAVEESITKH